MSAASSRSTAFERVGRGGSFRTKVDLLNVEVYPTRATMGAAAAAACAAALREDLVLRGRCRTVFAAAPSQNELLACLTAASDIDWRRVEAFHMDEYLDLAPAAPQRFAAYLDEHVFGKVPFAAVHYVLPDSVLAASVGSATLAEVAAASYAKLLAAASIDVVCLGVGENGHLAFNDPPVADFADPLLVKEVELDEACRRQQVNDGCFPALPSVPKRALTLTIPALMRGRRLFCVVPGAAKARAIHAMLTGPIVTACPASVLRRHPACTLYLDSDSARKWLNAGNT